MIDATLLSNTGSGCFDPFVRAHLPPAPSRTLEIGCGPSRPGYHQTEFENHQSTGPARRDRGLNLTLHHINDLDQILDQRGRHCRHPQGWVVLPPQCGVTPTG
jgi:hypothetical protein